jgi:hypothetical protein
MIKRQRRQIKVASRRFLLGAAYGAGSGCVSLIIFWAQHRP